MIEKYLEDNNLEPVEIVYIEDGYHLWQLSPSGGILCYNDSVITYVPQKQVDNFDKETLLQCIKFNK